MVDKQFKVQPVKNKQNISQKQIFIPRPIQQDGSLYYVFKFKEHMKRKKSNNLSRIMGKR